MLYLYVKTGRELTEKTSKSYKLGTQTRALCFASQNTTLLRVKIKIIVGLQRLQLVIYLDVVGSIDGNIFNLSVTFLKPTIVLF